MSDDEIKKEPENTEPEVPEFEFNEDHEGKSETSYGAGGEEEFIKKLKKLKLELKNCQKEKAEYLTGWQKERADFANYKKEEDNRRALFSEGLRERILSRFLTVIDSFNMAFANKESWDKVDPNWRKGVEYIFGQMNSIFEEYGVRPVGEEGESFDPNIHQSVDIAETDEEDLEHKVAEVVQRGYVLGRDLPAGKAGRVMRPARVKVYEYRKPT